MINRVHVGALVLSASTLVGIALHERYVPQAMIPVPGDVPTIGFGTTEDVKLGDRITVERALVRLLSDASKFEAAVKRCAPVPMYQYEFDAYVSLTYNIGETAFCNSTLAKQLKAGNYEAACKEILKWDNFKGKPLRGLTIRRQKEYQQCLGQQQ
jgi:lysozyme